MLARAKPLPAFRKQLLVKRHAIPFGLANLRPIRIAVVGYQDAAQNAYPVRARVATLCGKLGSPWVKCRSSGALGQEVGLIVRRAQGASF